MSAVIRVIVGFICGIGFLYYMQLCFMLVEYLYDSLELRLLHMLVFLVLGVIMIGYTLLFANEQIDKL